MIDSDESKKHIPTEVVLVIVFTTAIVTFTEIEGMNIVKARSSGQLQGDNIFQTQQDWLIHAWTQSNRDSTHNNCISSSQTESQKVEGKLGTKFLS